MSDKRPPNLVGINDPKHPFHRKLYAPKPQDERDSEEPKPSEGEEAPDRIWLQIGAGMDGYGLNATWHSEPIGEPDMEEVEYVRADLRPTDGKLEVGVHIQMQDGEGWKAVGGATTMEGLCEVVADYAGMPNPVRAIH